MLSFQVSEIEVVHLFLLIDHLIIEAENGPRIDGAVFAIGLINHHAQIHSSVKHVAGNIFPCVWRIGELKA